MKKILFICHGNICRSPMAEFVMKDLVNKEGLEDQIVVDSSAATNDAVGMQTDVRTRRILDKHKIKYTKHLAKKMTKEDYSKYDYLICMDEENFLDMNQITGGDPEQKEFKLLHFANSTRDIEDPWYTNDFEKAYQDIHEGCKGLLEAIKDNL